MYRITKLLSTAATLLACAVTPAIGAPVFLTNGGINQSTPNLPPSNGGYVSPANVHACFALVGFGSPLCLVQGDHQFFLNPNYSQHQGTNDGIDTFNSTFTGVATGGPLGNSTQPVLLTGPVSITLFGRPTNNMTGTFNTEMTQLDLSGGGIFIRESPTLQSTGATMITDNGNGTFHIDSFFDIFTELSLDGGQTWTPSSSSTHVDLVAAAPEPGTLFLLGAGALVLVLRGRRAA
jgi:PEP-CTERM motif